MKLIKINIGANIYINKFELVDKTIVTEVTTEEIYESLLAPTKTDAIWKQSSIRIGFDTPTGKLTDSQYATQENGFHWVKIPGYAVTKINPEFIKDDILTPEGEIDVKERSVAE